MDSKGVEMKIFRLILEELILIRKELQSIRSAMEFSSITSLDNQLGEIALNLPKREDGCHKE